MLCCKFFCHLTIVYSVNTLKYKLVLPWNFPKVNRGPHINWTSTNNNTPTFFFHQPKSGRKTKTWRIIAHTSCVNRTYDHTHTVSDCWELSLTEYAEWVTSVLSCRWTDLGGLAEGENLLHKCLTSWRNIPSPSPHQGLQLRQMSSTSRAPPDPINHSLSCIDKSRENCLCASKLA